MARAIVYVDGFNLYYGALRGTSFRWLDLPAMARRLLPKDEVVAVRYFTALVGARDGDHGQRVRQELYLRALSTCPEVTLEFGHYLSHTVWMRLAEPVVGQRRFVRVIKTEEKGSDVNLATALVSDGYEGRFDVAVVISNDSDLLAPMRLVRDRLQMRIGILSPVAQSSRVLRESATFTKPIRSGVLRASQFPAVLRDAKGEIRRPASW